MAAVRLSLAASVVVLAIAGIGTARAQAPRELREKAADLLYNLDHDAALTLLRQAAATAPDDSSNHRAVASAIWLKVLFQRGAVTVDHYLGSFTKPTVDLKNPPTELDAEFTREITKAIELAEKRVAASPKDPQAQFDLGSAVGLQATYVASVQGRVMDGFKAARRSYDAQETVLRLDPNRREAGLAVGTYRYVVSTLPLVMRWAAYMAGFGGGKEKGIQMIEETVTAARENRTDAQFALVLLYNRERRYDDAMKVMADLRRRYPRNRLVLLEAGATATRANRPAEAEALLSEGMAMLAKDTRPRIPAEEALWHYKRGAARVMLQKREDALADLRAAETPATPLWIRGRTHLELARLAQQQKDRETARREAAEATTLCTQGNDPGCAAEAKKIR